MTRRARVATVAELERDVTILVKRFERLDSFHRLLASIRRFYPRIPLVVVDDSAVPLETVPQGVRYYHLPHNSLGLAGGRNFGLRHVETGYVVICDDDMVFGRRTDLSKMLHVLETTRFDIVASTWMDHDPWRSIRLGRSRLEGTAEFVGGDLVRRLGVDNGQLDGLPAYDVVANFFMARVERLGPDPWNERLNFMEHVEFFISMKERGLLATCLPDVVVYHHPQLPQEYSDVRQNRKPYLDVWRKERGFDQKIFVGPSFSRRDRIVHYYPGIAAYTVRRAGRVVRERLIRSRGNAHI
jgi:hypothetical protein